MKTCKLILLFYKNFFFLSFILTLCCAFILYVNGISAFTIVFWFKLLTLALIFYGINQYKKHEFYYYQNLGISQLTLWLVSFGVDMLLFILLMALTCKPS